MSYQAFISFKKIKPEDIYDFFVNFKQEAINRITDIAKENCHYVPFSRNHIFVERKWDKISDEDMKASKTWAQNLFKYRYFYDRKNQLLGIYGTPSALNNLFDKTIFFQNGTDQDYDRETWEGIKKKKKIYDRINQMADDEFCKYYAEKSSELDETDLSNIEYYKKSQAYSEIWDKISDTLYNDNKIVYLSLFSEYDYDIVMKLLICCHKEIVAYENSIGITDEYLNKNNNSNETIGEISDNLSETDTKSSEISDNLSEIDAKSNEKYKEER